MENCSATCSGLDIYLRSMDDGRIQTDLLHSELADRAVSLACPALRLNDSCKRELKGVNIAAFAVLFRLIN